MKVSLLLLTMNRYEITSKTVAHNLRNPGHDDWELLVADQGSKDKRIVNFIAKIKPLYHRLNSRNEGVGHSFNQLYLRCTGEVICLFPNDILLPEGWLGHALALMKIVPNCGLAGFDWGHSGTPPITVRFGLKAHWLNETLNRIFGVTLLPRKVIDVVGFFNENYGVYGLEDSSLNERVNRAGFNSFYIPGVRSEHIGHDAEDKEYRKMKDQALEFNAKVFGQDAAAGFPKPDLPPARDPI